MTMNALAVAHGSPKLDVEELYREHHAAVMRYVRARVATRDLAEDLVADVFCRAAGASPRYRRLRESALPWLYTIAAHRVADHYRRQRPTCSLDAVFGLEDSAVGPAEKVLQRYDVKSVWEYSQLLPESQRTALWLRYGEDRDLKEIAARMGRTVEAVKLLIHRAVRGIRHAMAEAETVPPQRLRSLAAA